MTLTCRPVLAAVLALSATITACGTKGTTLRPVDPAYTTLAAPSTTDAAIDANTNDTEGASVIPELVSFRLTGPFTDNALIPATVTCKGPAAYPSLSWDAPPTGTVELVLAVTDSDNQGFVSWIVAGITPITTGFPEGKLPAGAIQAVSDAGTAGWALCPPIGSSHHYTFTLYAEGSATGITSVTTGRAAIDAAKLHATAQAVLHGIATA
jgi:phosphatidylethanolamine-binding protein (PEBP) family uncharacterized protein